MKGVTKVFIDFASYFVQSSKCHVDIFISTDFPSPYNFFSALCVCASANAAIPSTKIPIYQYTSNRKLFPLCGENGRASERRPLMKIENGVSFSLSIPLIRQFNGVLSRFSDEI